MSLVEGVNGVLTLGGPALVITGAAAWSAYNSMRSRQLLEVMAAEPRVGRATGSFSHQGSQVLPSVSVRLVTTLPGLEHPVQEVELTAMGATSEEARESLRYVLSAAEVLRREGHE